LLLAAERVQRGKSLRQEVPIRLDVDLTKETPKKMALLEEVPPCAEAAGVAHDHLCRMQQSFMRKEAEWERERQRLERSILKLEADNAELGEQTRQKAYSQSEWESERQRLQRSILKLENENEELGEHARQKERGLQRDCKCLRAERDKLSNALEQLKQQRQQQQQQEKENLQRRDKEVQALALEQDSLQNAVESAKVNAQAYQHTIQSLQLQVEEGEVLRGELMSQLSQTEQSLKKDLSAVAQARLTSKERLLEMSTSFQEVAEKNIKLKEELKTRRNEQRAAEKASASTAAVNIKLAKDLAQHVLKLSQRMEKGLEVMGASARAAKALRDQSLRSVLQQVG
jgi:chromosome segregation ATPase